MYQRDDGALSVSEDEILLHAITFSLLHHACWKTERKT
jgi:hypothetical protein